MEKIVKKNHCLFNTAAVLLTLIIMVVCSKDSTPTEISNGQYDNNWLEITEEVNGTLEEKNGIQVMKLWGTSYEQGYAHGYFKGPEIVSMLNEILRTRFKGITSQIYEETFIPGLAILNVEQRFNSEIHGVFDGLTARGGGTVYIPVLKREITYEDVLLLNSLGELLSLNCSSFAAWGAMTEDGNTIAGKNMDWFITSALAGIDQFICVRKQESGNGIFSTVSISWPGTFSTGTVLTSEGILIVTHDTDGYSPERTENIHPISTIGTSAIEHAGLSTPLLDVEQILKSHYTVVDQNFLMVIPGEGNEEHGYVFEYDGHHSNNDGMTLRSPENSNPYIICTNHYRARKSPITCWRYNKLKQRLEEIKNSGGTQVLTVNKAWDMLSEVPIGGSLVYHSIVYEAEKKKLHIAITDQQDHAFECSKVTFELSELLNY